MPQLGERGCISVVKEIADSDVFQKVLERFDQPGWPSQIGSLEAEIEGTQLVLRYTSTGTKFGKFKTMVEIPQAVGDVVWNRYVQESRDITYWIDWAVISPVVEAYATGDIDRDADDDGYILLPVVS
ncbi:hypothetical protein AQ436_15975 [Arthrobacter sp. EpRS66]|nr:hypothetical protein AQ436_15975 [Arthrobacter sp. EpRS66]